MEIQKSQKIGLNPSDLAVHLSWIYQTVVWVRNTSYSSDLKYYLAACNASQTPSRQDRAHIDNDNIGIVLWCKQLEI